MAEGIANHPSRQQLEKFVQGKLQGDAQSAVETHVSECDTCCKILREIPHGELEERLRMVRAEVSSGDTQIAQMHLDGMQEPEVPLNLADHPRYHIVKRLGAGGMGVVYQAEHRLMGRTVALKVINRKLLQNEGGIERFRKEVRAAARLSHRNIVTAHDAEQAGNLHFLVMEFVEGTDLASLLTEYGRLPILHACNYVMQAALGLQHAHEQGMVHRDIKPQNLMRSSKGVVKILDFGLARFAEPQAPLPEPSGLTGEGVTLGTPDYIAPEQARDSRRADIRSDIYSLGCTLYYLLTGSVPYPSGTPLEKVISHCKSEPLSITVRRSGIPDPLVAVVEKMMAKDPGERYQTPQEVVEALSPFGRKASQPPPLPDPEAQDQESKSDTQHLDTVTSSDLVTSHNLEAEGNRATSRSRSRKRHVVPRRMMIYAGAVCGLCLLGFLVSTFWPDRPGPGSLTAWVNLIPQVVPERDAVGGFWQTQSGVLAVDASEWARISIPYIPPREYDLEVSFTRQTGEDSIALMFAAGKGRATFEVDAWREHLVGFQEVAGADLKKTSNPTRQVGQALRNGETHTVLLEVREQSVTATFDGQVAARYSGDGSNLSMLPEWQLPHEQLGVGAYRSQTTFHAIRLRPVR